MNEALTALSSLLSDIESVSVGEVEVAGRRLTKVEPKEKTLGTIHNHETRKLWTLAQRYQAQAKTATIDKEYTAVTEEDLERATQKEQRCLSLEQITREMFWMQAKDDIGSIAWTPDGIGLRAGWMIVVPTAKPSPQEILSKLFGISGGGE